MKKTNTSSVSAFTTWSVLLIVVLAAIIFLPAINENRTARADLLKMWHSQAALLSETVLRTADKIAVFDKEVQHSRDERLMDLAQYIRQLDSLHYPNHRPVMRYIRSQLRAMTFYLDEEGNILMPMHRHTDELLERLLKENVAAVKDRPAGGGNICPLKSDEPGAPVAVGVLIRRVQTKGYIALLPRPFFMNRPIAARRIVGWLNHIAQNPGIEYIILWQGSKMVAHSGALPKTENMFPPNIGPPQSRLRRFKNITAFEFRRAEPNGLAIAIGLSTKPYDDLRRSLMRRLILNSLLLLFVGGVLSVYILKRQNFALLSRKYERLQTSTSAILENMDEGIIVLDHNRTIAMINRTAEPLFVSPFDNIVGKGLLQAGFKLPPELISRILSYEVLKDAEADLTINNQIRSFLINTQPLSFKNEQKSDVQEQMYIILLRDNTNQKELAAYRRRKSKLQAMGELASRVAHEIRNPLNGIGVLAQRLAREFKPEKDSDEYLQMTEAIRQESKRINRIIETFLAYARQPRLNLKNIDLNKLIEDNRPVFNAAGQAGLEYDLEPSCYVLADAEQITQALLNLIKNAMDVTPRGESIHLKLRCRAHKALILVEDAGGGIGEDIMDNIFDLYFTTKEDGNGLGLSIVEKIISSHGGKVMCENIYGLQSAAPLGARFIIELPLAAQEEEIA